MHNPYRGGTFDDWYSGTKSDIWVEYKWERNPLSPLQMKWGQERYTEGRSVFVIAGNKNGGVWYGTPETWEALEGGIDMTKAEIVAWLVDQTMEISLDGNTSNVKTVQKRKRNGQRVQNPNHRSPNIRTV